MRKRLLLSAVLAASGCNDPAPITKLPPAQTFASTCTAAAPTDEAKRVAGRNTDGTVILPGGRKLTPAGTVLDVGGFPLAMKLLPNTGAAERYVVVTDGAIGDEALRIVDLQATDPAKAVVSELDYKYLGEGGKSPALFYGLALTRDGTRVYVSNGGHDPVPDTAPLSTHYNTVEAIDIVTPSPNAAPQLEPNDGALVKLRFDLGNGTVVSQRYPSGLALSSDETLLYVANQLDGSLSIVSLASGAAQYTEIGRAVLPGIGPYDVAVDENTHTAFVSLWGGLSKGPEQYVDGLAVVDVSKPNAPVAMMDVLPTGKASEAELILAGKLYVANADSDTLSVVDLASKTVKSSPVTASMLVGASPNHLAIDSAAGRIYVANAGENAVLVLDLATMQPRGRIPTAWYPTAVAVRSDGSLVIASGKGLGQGPASKSLDYGDYGHGTLQLVAKPSDADLAAYDQKVAANFGRPRANEVTVDCESGKPKAFPLPLDDKGATPIKRVYLIVRENKTYDAVLGDLDTGNGDKTLAMFGEDVTPNTHALSRAFVTADNFYSLADQSLQGHEWTTAAAANDYTEKGWLTTWGRATRPAGAFATGLYERLGHPGGPSIFSHLDAAGVAYRNYGEVVNTAGAKILLDPSYPGVIFNLGLPDVQKIAYVVEHLTEDEFLKPFSYVVLPNDHTYGTTPGKPTPQSMVADNDEATGRFIDALSHSSLWSESIVFVIEDDPQDRGDHVEPHRSILLAASPWIKRGYHAGANYDVPSLYRTIELLLGVGPMNLNDANAPAMYDLFSPTPDPTPYTFIPRKVAEIKNTSDSPLSDESARIDWSKPDQAPLGRILWKATHGAAAEPPWRKKGETVRLDPDFDD